MSTTTYTISDVRHADRLWDEHSLREIADRTGISLSTLGRWSRQGWISTETDHRLDYDPETIARAGRFWDHYPLPDVADLIGVPYSTLASWAQRGWIKTETTHKGQHQRQGMRQKVRTAVALVYDRDLLQKEAADRMGVSQGTISRYLKLYREGVYT